VRRSSPRRRAQEAPEVDQPDVEVMTSRCRHGAADDRRIEPSERPHRCGKRRTLVAVAVARELAGFCWALANTD
jgi:hypothetical protein